MKKRAMLLFVFIMIATLFLASCDRRGDLSSAETEELYAEIKELFTTGEIFNYQTEPEINTNFKPIEAVDIEFIKSLVEPIFDESNQLGKYGLWWSSKRYCRACVIKCSLPMQYDGSSCVVERFDAALYKDGTVAVIIDYHLDGSKDDDTQRVGARFKPNP